MWDPVYMRIRNFGSHLDSKIFFKFKEPRLVLGVNLDEEGNDSNGSGKSHIVEAMSKLISNKTNKKGVRKSRLIRHGEDRSVITGVFKNTVNSDILKIERIINKKGSDTVSVSLNGKEKKNDNINGWILKKFGLSYEELSSLFLIGQGVSSGFFNIGDSAMKKLIFEFTEEERIDEAISIAKFRFQEYTDKFRKLEIESNRLKGSAETLLKEKKQLKKKGTKLERKGKKAKQILKEIVRAENKSKHFKELATEFDMNFGNIDKGIKRLERKLVVLRERDRSLVDKNVGLREKKRNKVSILHGEIKCPKCDFSFNENNEEIHTNELKREIKTLAKKMKKVFSNSQGNSKELETVKQALKDLIRIKEEGVLLGEKEIFWAGKAETLEKKTDKFEREKRDDFEKSLNRLNKKIKKLNTLIGAKEEKTKKTKNKLKAYEFWKVKFGSKGFKNYLLNKSLKIFEGYVNNYLQMFKTSLEVSLEGFKMKADGEYSENISVKILKDGLDFGNYTEKSGGEKKRLDFSALLARREMKTMGLEKGAGLNMLFLDEAFQGLDFSGKREMLKLFKALPYSVMCITHGTQGMSVEGVSRIYVKMEGGISKMVLDEEYENMTKNNKK